MTRHDFGKTLALSHHDPCTTHAWLLYDSSMALTWHGHASCMILVFVYQWKPFAWLRSKTLAWHRHDCCMTQVWLMCDLVKTLAWHRHDSDNAFVWHRHDLGKTLAWHRHDSNMVFAWHRHDLGKTLAWHRHDSGIGFCLTQAWAIGKTLASYHDWGMTPSLHHSLTFLLSLFQPLPLLFSLLHTHHGTGGHYS